LLLLQTRTVYSSQHSANQHFMCNTLLQSYVTGCDACYYGRDRSKPYGTCVRRQNAYNLELSHAKRGSVANIMVYSHSKDAGWYSY
jgi:hypothetical protein